MFPPPFSRHAQPSMWLRLRQADWYTLSDAPLDASCILLCLLLGGNFPLDFSGSGWELLALPPWPLLGGVALQVKRERQARCKTGIEYETRRRSAKDCPEDSCLEKRWTLLIWAIPFFSVKMKEQAFKFISLNKPLEILEGKKSHCTRQHLFWDIKVADLIFLSGLAISCTNPLRVQW